MDAPGERIQRIGHGRFDPLSGELSLDGGSVTLRPRTAALLAYLVRHGDRVVAKDELMQAIWPDVVVTDDSLVQCVKEIRQALGPAGRAWIRTVPRQGYAFIGPPSCEAEVPPPESGLASARPAPAPPPSTQPASRLEAAKTHWRALAAAASATVVIAVAAGAWAWHGWQADRTARAAQPLSIVVMPIANATGSPAQDNAVDDLTEALTDSLARSAGTTVIAPSTAFTFKGKPIDPRRVGTDLHVHYVLEGSLRLEGKDPVLTVRLADAADAVQLWNQEFRPAAGASLREMVVRRVAGTLGLHLFRAEARSRDAAFETGGTAALLSQARAAARGGSMESSAQVRSLLETAVREGDDGDAEALALLATSYIWGARMSFNRARDLETAQHHIERALALAPDNDKVRLAEGRVYGEVGNQPRSLAAYERALAINPSNANAHAGRGDALIMLGRAQEALPEIEYAMRISPYDPKFFVWQVYAGVAHLHLKHDAQALSLLSEVSRMHPYEAFFHLFLASALGVSGRIDEARTEMAMFQRLRPGMTLSDFRALEPTNAPEFFVQRQHVYDGLRLAGMPE